MIGWPLVIESVVIFLEQARIGWQRPRSPGVTDGLRRAAMRFIAILKTSASRFVADHATRLSAALAYYSAFSLAPLLIIAISIAGLVYGEKAASGVMEEQLTGAIGREAAATIQDMITSARQSGGSLTMAVVGFAVLLVSASGVFVQLKDAMNTVWGRETARGGGIHAFVRNRLLSLLMVIFIGLLLLFSLVMSTVMSATNSWLGEHFPVSPLVWQAADFAVSLAIMTVLFAMIFKILPDADVQWRDVWTGALLTSVLFIIGKALLAFYLGRKGGASAYGAAGALILTLSWIYYSANILLFGAE